MPVLRMGSYFLTSRSFSRKLDTIYSILKMCILILSFFSEGMRRPFNVSAYTFINTFKHVIDVFDPFMPRADFQ